MLSSAELSGLWHKHAAALLLIARGRCGSKAGAAAEDCVQEAFVRLASQDPPPDIPGAWLMKTVRNAAIDVVRSENRRSHREERVARNRPAWLMADTTKAYERLSTEEVQIALQQLSDDTRDIVVAHLWNNMSFREIADAVGVSSATAHRRYESGLQQLRHLMTAEDTLNGK